LQDVTTFGRLERATRAFVPAMSAHRFLVSPRHGVPFAEELVLDGTTESSTGDAMHKLVFLVAGRLDLEGDLGGWLLLPDHMVFIPAERAFAICSSPQTRLIVAHLDPGDAEWHHHGCWITAIPDLARAMLTHALRWQSPEAGQDDGPRLFFRTLSHLCQEWFSTPRILWMPAAKSDEVRAAVGYVRDHLDEAALEGAAIAARCSARTLQRRCREEFGFSWRSFSREVRIMRAMELLARREMRIGAVSQATGFRSVAAFTVSFSDRLGISPSEFARRMDANRTMKSRWASDGRQAP